MPYHGILERHICTNIVQEVSCGGSPSQAYLRSCSPVSLAAEIDSATTERRKTSWLTKVIPRIIVLLLYTPAVAMVSGPRRRSALLPEKPGAQRWRCTWLSAELHHCSRTPSMGCCHALQHSPLLLIHCIVMCRAPRFATAPWESLGPSACFECHIPSPPCESSVFGRVPSSSAVPFLVLLRVCR